MTHQMMLDDTYKSKSVSVPDCGLLVSNHLNLMYMLSAGLIMPPSGFSGNYYQDTLGDFPGWIPLFIRKKISGVAVSASENEAEYLKPCVAQIELKNLTGPVWVLRDNNIVSIEFRTEINDADEVIFVPAPLPTAWIERIVFRSQDEKTACDREARDFNNVPWTDFKRVLGKRLFTGTRQTSSSWPPDVSLPEHAPPLTGPLAAGGSMAMLLHVANYGDRGVQFCQLAFDPLNAQDESTASDFILAGYGPWLQQTTSRRETELMNIPSDSVGTRVLQQQLYWGIVERLVEEKSADRSMSAKNTVLDYLEDRAGQIQNPLGKRVREFREALKNLTGLRALGITEMFERFPSSFSRALTLFFLRRNCAQLLEFQHPLLTEDDWLAVALLFGVRSGWQELPLDLRNIQKDILSRAISHRMAGMAHRMAQTSIDLGEPPQRPQPLREIFMGDWKKRHQDAALKLVEKQKWTDCIQTTIKLSNGHYKLSGRRNGGIQISWQGTPEDISHDVTKDRFLQHLAEEKIDRKTVDKVYSTLNIRT